MILFVTINLINIYCRSLYNFFCFIYTIQKSNIAWEMYYESNFAYPYIWLHSDRDIAHNGYSFISSKRNFMFIHQILWIFSIRPTWTKRAMQGFHDNQFDQYPLQTVTVRWQLKRKLPKYNPETLRYILEPFGDIRDIRILSPNSCIVIFADISSACRVVQSRCIGDPMNKLNCTWWHKSMANKCVAARANGLSIKTDVFIV